MKICIIVGTRPEIIKMSPIIKQCQKRQIDFDVINPRQHFDDNMSGNFFRELDLPPPSISFKVKPGGHAAQLSSMLISFDRIFSKSSYAVVLVQGDTNSAFAAALIASRHNIPVGHVEAGLRSRDRTMPEEINRILIDHLSTYLFAPTSESVDNLKQSGLSQTQIWNTGNTVVDATLLALDLAKRRSFDLPPFKDYILLTLHRPSNVDAPGSLEEIITGVEEVSDKYNLPVVFPLHPRTKSKIQALKLSTRFHLTPPVSYLDFLNLLSRTRLIMTDSGGIQEEACIINIPCVTLRTNTERPETVAIGANILGGITKKTILQASDKMLKNPRHWKSPFGDGHSAEKILDILINCL